MIFVTKMPLSRHFYSLDEVQAALLYTTTHNTPTEALFWCQELILSGCIAEAISTLFQSWLWHTGPMRLQWLIDAWKNLASDELTENDILLATYQLSNIPQASRDNSLWNILVLNSQEIPDRVTKKTPKIYPSTDEKELYFIRSIFQGKARCACWISNYIQSERIWSLLDWYIDNVIIKYQEKYRICIKALKNYEKLLGYRNDEYDIVTRNMSIIMICLYKQDHSFKEQIFEIDNSNKQFLVELSLSVGTKDRRVYQIPKACLYGVTFRGRNKWTQHNFTQLSNIEKYLVGCPFWDEVIEEFAEVDEKGVIQWKSYEDMELFYNKYFPDDIPDEWSKKDKEKSHGDGLLGPNEKITILKYSRQFMSKIPHFAWNTTKIANKFLDNINIDIDYEFNPEKIVSFFNHSYELSKENLKKLLPVQKKKSII